MRPYAQHTSFTLNYAYFLLVWCLICIKVIIWGEDNLLKFDFKNKFKSNNKENDSKSPDENETDLGKEKENNLKTEMLTSILKAGSIGEEDKTVTFADLSAVEEELVPKTKKIQESRFEQQSNESALEEKLKAKLQERVTAEIEIKQNKIQFQEEITSKKSVKQISPESEKISKLIQAIETSNEKMIIPLIDMGQGKITYPILEQIGEPIDNIDFLEQLTSENFDILKRTVYERLAVCPDHPESMTTTVRLHCPECTSMDITKLHLIEHKRCGYISENKNFEFSDDGKIISCPSCKKQIRDVNREIARPAMWYTCNECKEKFDDVSIKLHCRKANHDFEISDAHSISIPGFIIKNLQDASNSSISPILKSLKKLLDSFGFSANENHTVIGKSGNTYRINIHGEDENKRTIFIYVKNPNAESDNSELNSKIIEVLDTTPTVTILIGFPSISEKAKTITSNYNISLITEQEPNKILSSIKDILSKKLPKLES